MTLTKTDLQTIEKLLNKQRKSTNQEIGEFITNNVISPIDELETKIDKLETKMEQGFDEVEKRFDKVDDRLDRMSTTLTNHKSRLKKLEKIHPNNKHSTQTPN